MNTTDIKDAIRNRHAVREYYNRTIDASTAAQLNEEIARCNEEGGLHIQLITDEPRAFGGQMARYGKFNNVKNYIALAGKKDPGLEEKIGYYGERIALKAQILGLNTCWVALTFSKRKAKKHFKLAAPPRGCPTRVKPIRSCAAFREICLPGSKREWTAPCWRLPR